MKRFYLFLMAVFAFVAAGAQEMPPEFSTEANPFWYQVQFKNGSGCLADQGANANLRTAAKANADAQKWQLIGTADNFKMKSKTGRYVNFSGGKFTTSTTGVALKIVKSTASGAEGCWEIQRVGSTSSMNQWGGAGTGKELGEWSAGDPNNPLNFVALSISMPEFSTADNEKWYFIQSKKGNTTLADMGLGEAARLQAVDPSDSQLWKFVGDQNNFQIVNKLGHYLEISSTGLTAEEANKFGVNGGKNDNPVRTSEAEYAGGFSLAESTSSNFSPAWLIKPNNNGGGYFNAWGGTGLGACIGLWTDKSDDNNAFLFIDPDKMKYDDFKVIGAENFTPENPLTLWYNQPATLTGVANKWMEYSLPIGNGQLGACLFGGIQKDEIQFNEKTLWQGGPNDMGSYGGYKNFGSVFVEDLSGSIGYGVSSAAKDYVRYLDIETATAGVKYTNADGTKSYERKYISSEPDQVIAAQYTASEGEKLNLKFYMKPGTGINASAVTYNGATATFGGKLQTVTYRSYLRVVPTGEGAQVTSDNDGITVSNADAVTLIFTGATDFDLSVESCVSGTAQLPAKVQGFVDAAAEKGWDAIYADHVANHKSYMGRTSFQLAGAASNVPTNVLVDNYNNSSLNVNGTEPHVLFLEQLYFAYGRYLLISSSRGINNVPNNLQGIWNDKESAPWNSDIHTNINIQMNYWPAEPTNLSELHEPLLNHIITLAQRPNWQKAAQRGGQTKGWTVFTESNIFGGMSTWGSNYFVVNAWYCSHLWQHYRYTLDKEFLAKAFPVMWSSAEFWFERMIQDRVVNDGTYVCPDEYSPEQNDHPTEDGTAHAQQLVYANLTYVKEALEILGQEACGLTDDEVAQLDEYLAKTDKGLHVEEFKGGDWASWGAQNGISTGDPLLKEWKYTAYDVSSDKGHRHISHLMCLYPLDQVSASSPYFVPAVNALKLRGDEATGWSMGWKVNLWARALDGDHAHIIIKNALKHSTAYGTNQYAGGIYYNLFDSHAPFQIDGNFGVCAGVAELLLQSHTDTIQVLPALPSVWKEGSVKGLKAVGNFTVDMDWKDNKATRITVVSNQGQKAVIQYPGIANHTCYVNGVLVTPTATGTDVVTLDTEIGDKIEIDIDGSIATGVGSVAADVMSIDVNDRTVTINSKDVVSITVFDLAGRALQKTGKSSIKVSDACGKFAIIEAKTKSGKIATYKVTLP